MKKTSFYIGLNDRESKVQEIATQNAKQLIENVFFELTDGATIYSARGIYKHNNGEKVQENTIIAECFDIDEKDIYAICEYLKKTLNQETIAVNIQEINAMYI